MNNDWIYIGVFLDDNSKIRLGGHLVENGISVPEGWKVYMHHMTLCFNRKSPDTDLMYDAFSHLLGQSVTLKVDSVGQTPDVIAVGVRTDMCTQNAYPHITIATADGVPPVMSNEIREWKEIPGIELTGEIREFVKRPKKAQQTETTAEK